MDLNKLNLEPRVRSPWEALDLGFMLARMWWKPLFLSWFIPALVVYLISTLIFFKFPYLPALIVWWFKPIFDRLPLFIVSRGIFGEMPDRHQVFSSMKDIYTYDAFAWLTYRRFSIVRSFILPVTVLEKLKHTERDRRVEVLNRKVGSAAAWLTTVCVHLEGVFILAFFSTLYMLIPNEIEIDWNYEWFETFLFNAFYNFVYLIIIAALAPFYVVAGFSLYINRRIELEAWDIELNFRSMSQRLKKLTFTLICLFAVSLSNFNIIDSSYAAVTNSQQVEGAKDIEPITESKQLIYDVLEREPFHQKREVKSWRLKNTDVMEDEDLIPEWFIRIVRWFESDDPDEEDQEDNWFIKWLKELFKSGESSEGEMNISMIFEIILWALMLMLLLYVILNYRNSLKQLVSSKQNSSLENKPKVLFGLDVSKESLPDNVIFSVRKHWQASEHRLAMALLYRATLTYLMDQHGFNFSDGDTEGECLAIVESANDERMTGFFRRLTLHWQMLAYGHVVPDSHQLESLCSKWQELFHDA